MEESRYTLEEIHLPFAKQIHGRVWQLLDKADRTSAEDEEMLCAAYASLYHWLFAGTEINQQRGHWLISRVAAVLGHGAEALRHATRCQELTEQYSQQMQDFDVAFAFEGVARAHAVLGNAAEAKEYLIRAEEAGRAIRDQEDREIFFDSLYAGDWHGVR
jgi:hypothetical protein